MSCDVVIRVEGVAKKYTIGRHAERQRYTTLRDAIERKVKGLSQSAAGLFRRTEKVKAVEAREFWALQDLNFEIRRGEVLGIIGRNGAGKSTLLKLLSRITEPSSGRIELRGRVASLLEVGTGFHPELTGRENIFLNGAILGMKRAEIARKFDEIVAFAEVEQFLDTPVKRYSSGMYVRLAFAVAAHLEPEILVVDEVLAVGDARFQRKCLGKMEDAGASGRTVLFVSHSMEAVRSLCGAGILLERGRVARQGPIAATVREYLDRLSKTGSAGHGSQVDLGPSLLLDRVEVASGDSEGRAPTSMRVRLVPKKPTIIRELSALVYSEHGVRVAVLDLRRARLLPAALCCDPFEFVMEIDTLPLVEGDYRLGFYVRTDDYQGNHLDVMSFRVPAPQNEDDLAQYPAQHRGFVDLGFSVRRQVWEGAGKVAS